MPEIRPAASLTSNLLARRGDARPAMRRQAISNLHAPLSQHDDLGWNDHGEEFDQDPLPASAPLGLTPPGRTGAARQPITFDDQPSAYDDQASAYDEEQDEFVIDVEEADEEQQGGGLSPFGRHLEAIANRLTSIGSDTSSKPMSIRLPAQAKPTKKFSVDSRKAAFTLRLDAERHLRLRLLSALVHRSSQQLHLEALDALLAQHDRIEDLAGQVETPGASHDGTTGLY